MQIFSVEEVLKRVAVAGGLLVAAGAAGPGLSASFDCRKAENEVEKMICADAKLSKLDEELAEVYQLALDTDYKDKPGVLRKEQLAWLKDRNQCKNALCVEALVRTRIIMLKLDLDGPSDASRYGRTGKFWLTYGHGMGVCTAYLESLNSSFYYERHPRCDRPPNDEVDGFEALERAPISLQELKELWPSVDWFLSFGTSGRSRAVDFGEEDLDHHPALRYLSAVDIDNDGKREPLLMWRTGGCTYVGSELWPWESIPIVLNSTGDGPDVERTREIFGHPSGGYRLSSGEMSDRFRALGRSMGLFQFEGMFYMDTFFDNWGDFLGTRQYDPDLAEDDPEIRNRLAVFLRQKGETEQVCEYWFEDFEARRRAALAK